MRRFVCCLLLPTLVFVGLASIGADKAEARRWVRHAPARVVKVKPRPYYRYSGAYRKPGVNVYAPGVRVHVGPRGYGGSVIAPGVRVGW